ncbi:uncharacterized protein LOC116351310 [Contarinia nasturtii]|uniref:uncharacterized protein LOC116350132 n=1 Tax=Contarinia nasturtii TaxID=265458 RepID=UPI0012D40A3F|nr:uncharacterized protein LOC116350132 [Contarinia nasturtii]XP_031639259.1 uncharacterized protein LOC116351310 [Contarinia nasturtii]
MEFKLNALISTMMLTIIFAIIVDCRLINAPTDAENEEYYFSGVPVYTPSRECSMAGGICVQEGDCAKGQLVGYKLGLCEDHEMGVECCYEVIPREAPCKQFGGKCTKNCKQNSLRQHLANDCTGDEICCVLVQ